jgi:hypothetical protein
MAHAPEQLRVSSAEDHPALCDEPSSPQNLRVSDERYAGSSLDRGHTEQRIEMRPGTARGSARRPRLEEAHSDGVQEALERALKMRREDF